MDLNEFLNQLAGLENGAELQTFIKGELSKLRAECADHRTKNKELMSHLAILGISEGDNPKEKATQIKASLDAIEAGGGDPNQVAGQLATLSGQVKTLTEKLSAAEKEKEKEKLQRVEQTKKSKVQELLTKGNVVNPEIAKIILPDVATGADDTFSLMMDGQELSIDEGIQKWLAANPWAVSTSQVPGSGGSGKGSAVKENPWKKETFNLTLQGKIYQEDPALAKRLQEEAQGK